MAVYDNLKRIDQNKVLGKDKETNDFDVADTDTIHICYPWSDTFIADTQEYIANYEPRLAIIYSTVPIGTTALFPQAVHSPIEGRHPQLSMSVASSVRYIGGEDKELVLQAANIWRRLSHGLVTVASSDWTEFLKLRSTAKYGVNLVWTDYEASVAKQLGMPFSYLKMFDEDYNYLYRTLNLNENQRYILDPPNGYIGGHCVVPNAELLNQQFPNDMLEDIISMGDRHE